MLPHLVIIEFDMFVAQAHTDIETAPLLCYLHKSGYVVLIHPVVCIAYFGDVCSKKICSARVSVFLAKPNLSLPERMTDN